MAELTPIYNSIRTQSLTTKEQRFRLYYWKVLTILILLGFSISKNSQIVDDTVKTFLIALVVPIIVMLFDLNIKGRGNAIKRDGELLMGLEDEIASKAKISPEILPERFYGRRHSDDRTDYWTAANRRYENLSQILVSLFAIISGWYIDYKVRNDFNIPVSAFNLPFFCYYVAATGIFIVRETQLFVNSTKNKKVKKRIKNLVARHIVHDFLVDEDAINKLINELQPSRERLAPQEKNEFFDVINHDGRPVGVKAPRWLCHLVGLRHWAAHVVLYFKTIEDTIIILQVRSWKKVDSPGHLDISVGGHVKSGSTPLDTALSEMAEEIGLKPSDLVNGSLEKILEYSAYNSTGDWFHNNERCEVFSGEIKPDSLKNVRFSDKEVMGMYLCPALELASLVKQKHFPIASALHNFILHRDQQELV